MADGKGSSTKRIIGSMLSGLSGPLGGGLLGGLGQGLLADDTADREGDVSALLAKAKTPIPSYQKGCKSVPKTGPAVLHKGERVLSLKEARKVKGKRFQSGRRGGR